MPRPESAGPGVQEDNITVTSIGPRHARLAWGFVLGAMATLLLVGYSWLRTPTTNVLSVAAATLVLVLYAAFGKWIVPRVARRNPAILDVAVRAGLLAGGLFVGEMLLESLLLPADNTVWGWVEFGAVFMVYAGASGWLTYRRHRLRAGVLGAVVTALISSLIWCIALWALFQLLAGTARQEQVFRAEGSYEDLARSGLADFNAFITEDFLGATFYHLLLGPLLASVLGVIGGLVGQGRRRLRKP
jgi:hypothetical protein